MNSFSYKKIFICFFLLSTLCFGQDKIGKGCRLRIVYTENEYLNLHSHIWSICKEITHKDGTRSYTTDRYVFGKDTIFDGIVYREVVCWENGNRHAAVPQPYAYREDSLRLYVYDYIEGKEYLVIDLGLKKGDIVSTGYSVFRVENFDGYYMDVYDTVNKEKDRWIREVGSQRAGIFWDRYRKPTDTIQHMLLCCNGEGMPNIHKDRNHPCYLSSEGRSDNFTGGLFLSYMPDAYGLGPAVMIEGITLKTPENDYILLRNTRWIKDQDTFFFNNVKYTVGDSVSITGTASYFYDLGITKKWELKIHSIKKLGRASSSAEEKNNLLSPFSVSVLPNPNNGNFRVEVNRPCSLEIYTETGVLVESRKLDAGTHNFSLGTGKNAVGRAAGGAGKAAGLYILKATAADGQALTRKIAVQ